LRSERSARSRPLQQATRGAQDGLVGEAVLAEQVIGLAERLQSIEGQIGEIKSMLSQMAASSGVSQGSDAALRPPRTKRPPSEGGEQT